MSWQDWLQQNLPPGTRETSGFRTPAQQRSLDGSSSTLHSTGTRAAPGAIDVGGPADKLKHLFDEIRKTFAGRINELYLNLPHGTSEAIRHNAPYSGNPEIGRGQHLHVALEASVVPVAPAQPAERIPPANRGQKALEAAPADMCARRLCPPDVKGYISGALGKTVEPQENCLCWSDVWFYGVGMGLVVGGAWMMFRGREK